MSQGQTHLKQQKFLLIFISMNMLLPQSHNTDAVIQRWGNADDLEIPMVKKLQQQHWHC